MSPALRVLADKGIKLHEWQERIVRAFESGAPVVVSPGWRRPARKKLSNKTKQ